MGGGQLWENIENLNKNTVSSVKLEQNNKQLNLNKKLIWKVRAYYAEIIARLPEKEEK